MGTAAHLHIDFDLVVMLRLPFLSVDMLCAYAATFLELLCCTFFRAYFHVAFVSASFAGLPNLAGTGHSDILHAYVQVCGLSAGCFAAAGALLVAGASACYLLAHPPVQVATCFTHLHVCFYSWAAQP